MDESKIMGHRFKVLKFKSNTLKKKSQSVVQTIRQMKLLYVSAVLGFITPLYVIYMFMVPRITV